MALGQYSMSAPVAALPADIDRALRAPIWHLRLPGQLEGQFHADSVASRMLHIRRSGWLAVFVFNSFLLADWLMAPDVFWLSVAVRMGFFTPMAMVALLAAQYYRTPLDRAPPAVPDLFVLSAGWCGALWLAYILVESQSAVVHYYHAGFLVVILYGNLVQQLSFRYAALFTAGVLVIHIGTMIITPAFPFWVGVALVQMVSVTAGFTLAANYMAERASKRRHLLLLRDHQLVQDLSRTNLALQKLSRRDVLTGVANRRHFQDYLREVWARAEVDREPLSLLMLDVDHFKAYNDRYGHPAGDECLRHVARVLDDNLRNTGDLVARFGGEEFVVVLPQTTQDAATQVAERVRAAIQELALPHEAAPMFQVVTVSIGVATVVAGTLGVHPDKLVSRADRALYDAKRSRRNLVRVFTDGAHTA